MSVPFTAPVQVWNWFISAVPSNAACRSIRVSFRATPDADHCAGIARLITTLRAFVTVRARASALGQSVNIDREISAAF
jgi:hypothetical protein